MIEWRNAGAEMTRAPQHPVVRVISGGQTGVDRGALEAALALGIEHGGWCPRGRRAEDGRVPNKYQLVECDAPGYHVRTEKNVVAADGTLIVFRREIKGGTALTQQLVKRHDKPCLLVDLDRKPLPGFVRQWLIDQQIAVLNVAGPRESTSPGIAAAAELFLRTVLRRD
jgi:hypothetical protein